MQKQDLIQRAKLILDANGKAEQVSFTSDNSAFIRESEANVHAKKLEDKTVITITRAELPAEAAQPEVGDPKKDETPVAKPLSKMNVEELKAEIAKREGLQVADNATKKVMIEAIEAFDTPAADVPAEGAGEGQE